MALSDELEDMQLGYGAEDADYLVRDSLAAKARALEERVRDHETALTMKRIHSDDLDALRAKMKKVRAVLWGSGAWEKEGDAEEAVGKALMLLDGGDSDE